MATRYNPGSTAVPCTHVTITNHIQTLRSHFCDDALPPTRGSKTNASWGIAASLENTGCMLPSCHATFPRIRRKTARSWGTTAPDDSLETELKFYRRVLSAIHFSLEHLATARATWDGSVHARCVKEHQDGELPRRSCFSPRLADL